MLRQIIALVSKLDVILQDNKEEKRELRATTMAVAAVTIAGDEEAGVKLVQPPATRVWGSIPRGENASKFR
jgi:hypothetical protein